MRQGLRRFLEQPKTYTHSADTPKILYLKHSFNLMSEILFQYLERG